MNCPATAAVAVSLLFLSACDAETKPGIADPTEGGGSHTPNGSDAGTRDAGPRRPPANPGIAPEVIITPSPTTHDAGPDGAVTADASADDDAGANPPTCGNGVVDPGEVCDRALSPCCNAACDGLLGAETVCRASAGACDAAEMCDGSRPECPADAFMAAEIVCRASAGACDLPEVCSGSSPRCPANVVAASTVMCRGATDLCDAAEFCDGVNEACPSDGVAGAGAPCRPATDLCDAVEVCDGALKTCPADQLEPSGTPCRTAGTTCEDSALCDGDSPQCPAAPPRTVGAECRPAAGPCDVAETCDGESTACPSDQFVSADVLCHASQGVCDPAEFCTGLAAGCPADLLADSSVECRAAEQPCDVAEFCTGASTDCPADAFAPATVECRTSEGKCDPAEFCTGLAPDCPGDILEDYTFLCRPSMGTCDPPEYCTGDAVDCPSDWIDVETTCRPSEGVCDPAEYCDGVNPDCPTDMREPVTTLCGASLGDCDVAEFCDGLSVDCPTDGFKPDTTECRKSAGDCDLAEFCTGSDALCPDDGFEPDTTECRTSLGKCDPAEFCPGDGADCPPEADPVGIVCRPVNGVCDVEETCDGSGPDCPSDVFLSDVPCGNPADPKLGCDDDDACDGSGPDCPDLVLPSGAVCRSRLPGDYCDIEETCNGTDASCPSDDRLKEGDSCDPGVGKGTCSNDLCCPGVTKNGGTGCDLGNAEDNIVFVTSVDRDGNLGGLGGADKLCNDIARNANLAGEFHAWLSIAGATAVHAIDRISDGPYYVVDDDTKAVAFDKVELRGGTLGRPIDRTEWAEPRQVPVWTGSSSSGGASAPMCTNWQDAAKTNAGRVGDSGKTDGSWTDTDSPLTCDAVAALYCFEDDCPGVPEVDFANDPNNCGACDNVCTSGICNNGACAHHVFVTSTQYKAADLGGSGAPLATADDICNTRAASAELPGSYVAWLSIASTPAASRLPAIGPFVTLDAQYQPTLVANDLADLLDGKLAAGIDLDESGTRISPVVWTGTRVDGSPSGETCLDWKDTGTEVGTVGQASATDSTWTDGNVDPGPLSCDGQAALYCFGK